MQKFPLDQDDQELTLEQLLQRRRNLLTATPEDLLAVAEDYSGAVDSPGLPIAGTVKKKVLKEIAEAGLVDGAKKKASPFLDNLLSKIQVKGRFPEEVVNYGNVIKKDDLIREKVGSVKVLDEEVPTTFGKVKVIDETIRDVKKLPSDIFDLNKFKDIPDIYIDSEGQIKIKPKK